MELLGAENLTNSELLAIIIKNGTKKSNCLQIAQKLLAGNKNITEVSDLEYLSMLSIQELMNFDGIGKIKAIQIKATIEFARRMNKKYVYNNKCKITSPSDAFNFVHDSYIGARQEILKIIILNKQNKVISIVDSAKGQLDKIDIDIRQIFSEPLKQMASSIILCHNHPGGTLKASKQDILFTKKINEYSKVFNINLLDHIIIANNKFISMKQLEYI